jgi:hypothetical protein|tara:strand:- start:704 stop:1039 length:336 start_codon:yes stop_codon:yes gene_type:complete
LTITDGLDAVAAVVALSITVELVEFVPVVLDVTVLELDDTVLELEDTVLELEDTVLPMVVFVTVSVANDGNAQNMSAMKATNSAPAASILTVIVLPFHLPSTTIQSFPVQR